MPIVLWWNNASIFELSSGCNSFGYKDGKREKLDFTDLCSVVLRESILSSITFQPSVWKSCPVRVSPRFFYFPLEVMFPHTWDICDVATILLRDNKMVHWRKSVQAISALLTFNIASAISKQRHSILDVFEPSFLGWLFSVAVIVDSIMYSSWPKVPMTQSVYCFMTCQRIWWFRNLLINPHIRSWSNKYKHW